MPPDPSEAWSISSANRLKLQQFWREGYTGLVRRARQICGGNPNNAEDLVSGATLRLLQFMERQDRPLDELDAIFWKIVRNLAIDEHRRMQRWSELPVQAADCGAISCTDRPSIAPDDSHARLVAREALAALQRQVAALPDAARALFLHRFVDERSYREIAEHFAISEPLARKRVQKLREQLAAATAEEVDGARSRRPGSRVYPQNVV